MTDAVLRRTSVPLMIVKPGNEDVTPHPSISRIVVPLDGSNAAETAVGSALWLAGHFGAAVTLYRPCRQPAQNLAVRARIPDGSCPIDVAVGVHRSPASGILKLPKGRPQT